MIIEIIETASAAACRVSRRLIEQIKRKPDSILGLATGDTMLPVYANLCTAYRAGEVSFAAVTCFNLDEYIGLTPQHAGSFAKYMHTALFDWVDITPDQYHLPRGDSSDPEAAAADYDALIKSFEPIDLQLLGIGRNGHIGFNEPFSAFDSGTQVKLLTEDTCKANRHYFASLAATPKRAITMGINTILAARQIVLLACGTSKAQAIQAACCNPVSAACPASILQTHPRVNVILDREAAQLLPSALSSPERNEKDTR